MFESQTIKSIERNIFANNLLIESQTEILSHHNSITYNFIKVKEPILTLTAVFPPLNFIEYSERKQCCSKTKRKIKISRD